MRSKTWRTIIGAAGVLGLCCAAAWAGHATYDFNSDPSGFLDIDSNLDPPPWRATGGNPGGYLAITDAVGSQYSIIRFADFDAGMVVKAFTFSMDVRVGNGTTDRPADGFSVNYAREGDPVLTVGGTGSFATSGAPETGTSTGLAVCFDAWQGNQLPDGDDIEGIIVRVDNQTVLRYGMPTRHGACEDITSLQTGPRDPNTDGDPTILCWQPLTVELNEDAQLTVTYKGATLLDHEQTAYFPTPGRLVLAGRTGGANENQHVDNIDITTVPADKALIGPVTGYANGFKLNIADAGQSVVDPATIALKLDGTEVAPTAVDKEGATTSVLYQQDDFLASGSIHTVDVSLKDTRGVEISATREFTVPTYALIPAEWALPSASDPGMNVGIYQIDASRGPGDANTLANAEQQWARGYIDPLTGEPYENMAFKDTDEADYVNWEQDCADIDGTPEDGPDHFNSALPADGPIPNDFMPGLPGFSVMGDSVDNVTIQVTTYLHLTPGYYRMGVNSDDGFRVSVAPGQPDVFGMTLGLFDSGRGAADTLFDFAVTQEGYYPFRLLWWEGSGGANVEWFTVNLFTGEYLLVNGPQSGAVKAYKTAAGRAHVTKMLPANGWAGVEPDQAFEWTLEDGATQVDPGSIKVYLEGEEQGGVTAGKTGGTTTARWQPAEPFEFGATYNGEFVWAEAGGETFTNAFSFTARPMEADDLPAGSFVIEAEMFDYDGGKSKMPPGQGYTGDEYDGLSAVHDVDYHENDNTPDQDNYRKGEDPNVPMEAQTDAGTLDVLRPGFEVTTNYKLGWTSAGEWLNYTRDIPAGVYTFYSANSHETGGTTVGGDLGLVTEGVGTTSQTVAPLASARGPAPAAGGWGNNALVPAKNPDGTPQAFKLPGGTTTLRYTKYNGDFDWFVLAPVTGLGPQLAQSPGGTVLWPDAVVLTWVINNLNTSVDPETVKVLLDGEDFTGNATVTAGDLQTTVVVDLTGVLEAPAGEHAWQLTFQDDGAPAQTYEYNGTATVAYAELPVAARSEPGSGETRGFRIRTWQLDGGGMVNNIEWAESVLAGLVGPNVADLTGFDAEGWYVETDTINYARAEGETNGNFVPDRQHPGIPGTTGSTENYASEIVTYVEFPAAGFYVMGVNSDDGFRVSVGEALGRQALEVVAPAAIAGPVPATPTINGVNGEFGGPLPSPAVEAPAVYVGTACDPAALGDLSGKVALIDRGDCTFVEKCAAAQAAGAVGVIVVDNSGGVAPIIMGGTDETITIPVVMVTTAAGQALKDNAEGLVVRLGADSNLKLGEFNHDRGAADTLFTIKVPEAGLYPLRCVYEQGGGGANIEWFTVKRDGTKALLNDGSDPDALKAWATRTGGGPEPTIGISMEGGQVKIEFTGTLQSADEVTGPWTDVPDATSPHTAAPEGARKFYRAKK